MKNLISLNRSGMSPEVTCRKGRHAIGSNLSRFSLASLICLCMLTIGVGNAWGANVTGTFTKITSTSALTTGYYIIVASESASTNNKAVGASVDSNKRIAGVTVTITSGTTISNPDAATVYLVTKTNSNYTFYNVSTSKYLYQAATTSGKGMGFKDASANITCAGYNSKSPIGFKFTLDGASNNIFKWNNGSSWFANYTGAYSTSMTPVRMYKAYKVTYDGNGKTGGTVPTDATYYSGNGTTSVTTKTNTGNLEKNGFTFAGWNTRADGEGTHYDAGGTFTISANTTLYAEWESSAPACSNAVALSKGSATNGTVNTISSASVETCSSTESDRRVTVTITPAACHDAPTNLTWTKTSGTVSASKQSGPTDNGDGTYSYVYQFAQNDNGAGTFGVTCTAKAAGKTVNFSAGPGSCLTSSLTETCDGSGVTLPAVTATGVCKGWTTFAGWATAAVNDSSTTSGVTLYAAGSNFVPASNGQTLYAVYSKVKGSPATWDKVTALSGITAGTYVIVSDGCALQNAEASSSPARDATNYGVTITNNQITSTVSDAMKWTFTGDSYSAITIKSYAYSDNYLYNGTNGNTGVRVGTTSDTWTFEVNTSAPAFAMYDATKSRYCCSTISDYNDWRSYTSADATNYRDGGIIYLFKQSGGSTTHYCSDPNCCTPLGSINGSISWSGGNTATVTWANNSNVSSYSVTCKAGGVSAGSVGSITGTTTKTCSITSLTAGTTYTITINATGKSGYCDASQEITSIAPKLTNAATALTGSNYAYGDGPGTEKSFTVTGIGLTGDITVTAPTDFEVSKSSGSGYASSVTYTPTSGSLSSTVYVRLAAGKSIGTYGASAITISGGGAANNTNVTIAGTVSSACTTAPTVSAATSSARTTSSITVNCAGISSLGTGTCTIDHYGFVYSTSANPKHTSDDSGTGTVIEKGTVYTTTNTAFGATTISGLTKGTTYYVRPYAHNSCGWAYGDQVTVTTLDLSSIAITTAPNKTAYFVGETFVSTGAVVTATYSDASTATVSADWTPTTALSAGEQTITATYTENGTTKSATTTVNVYAVTMQATDENGDAIAVGGPGAPTRSIKSISPAADAANYVFKQWTISGASLGSSATTKSNTITSPTGAVTVTAVYYKPRVVKWSVNGDDSYDEGSPTLTVAYNGTISAVPDAPDDDALSCANKFMGWSTKSAGATPKTTSYYDDLFTNASGYTTGITDATKTFYAVFAEVDEGNWTLDYSEEDDLSGSTSWGSYGTAYDYTASDGGTWTVKAYKNAGMQINTTKDASIKIPDCSGDITSIEITCSAAKAVGLSASDYTGSGVITYIAYGTDATSQTIDCSSKTATGGYIVPKSGSTSITKIVVNYGSASDYVTECDATKAKVTYDLNGGTGGCATGLYTKDGFTVCNTAVTKTGYTFSGWNDGTSTYAAGAAYTLTTNVTFTAQWTPVEYTITYNLDGGTNNIGNPASYTIESSDITLLTPTKTAGGYEYDFTGWTDDDDSDAPITTIASGSTGDKHVTATWAQKKRVQWYVGNTVQWTTFYASDGSGSLSLPNGGTPPSVPPTCGSKVFVGWTSDTPWDGETDTEPTVLFKAASGTVSDDANYYAVWADEHSEEAEGEIFSDAFNISGTDEVTSRDGWSSLSKLYGGSGSIRFSTGGGAGTMTLVKTGLGFGTTVTEATITFKIKKYGSDGSGVLSVSSNFSDATTTFSKDGGKTTSTSAQYSTTDGSNWTTCTCTVGSISASTDIILEGQTNSRVYVKDFSIEASGTTYTYDKYAIVCCNDPELAFGQTRYSLIREDLHGNTSGAYSTIELTYSSESSGTIRVWNQYDEDDNPEHSTKTAWQYTGANTWGTSPTTGGTAATASTHAYFEITDAANGKAKFYVKNTAGNTQGQGTYRVALHQAANGSYCETVTYCWIDVTLRDKFVDAVNGNTFPNADGHGPGGAAVSTPAENTRDADKDDDCHETTRRLVGWVKETDMDTWYGSSSDRTRDLDDKKEDAKLVAPGATITTSGATWYAVWGIEE